MRLVTVLSALSSPMAGQKLEKLSTSDADRTMQARMQDVHLTIGVFPAKEPCIDCSSDSMYLMALLDPGLFR